MSLLVAPVALNHCRIASALMHVYDARVRSSGMRCASRPPPSADDVALTIEIVAAGQLLDIELLDHLIIGRGRWLSLKRLGLGFPKA